MMLHLTPQQRLRLRRTRNATHDVGVFRRCLALLQLDRGHSVAAVAAELGVSRQSVYNWLDHYLMAPTPLALRDDRGHGHVTAWDEDLLAVLRSALEQPPGHWGYRDLEWTVGLLQRHLVRWDGRCWSKRTLRRQLHQLGYVWKRPRYVLQPDPLPARKMRRIRQQVKDLGPRAVLLFEDETDLLLFPPLRVLGTTRGVGDGCAQWPERATSRFRRNQCADRSPPAAAAPQATERGFPGIPPVDPRALPWLAGVAALGPRFQPHGRRFGLAGAGAGDRHALAAEALPGIERDGPPLGRCQG